jgi:hypothetical protein
MSVNKVAVQFKTFKIFGLIPITAPPSARGEQQQQQQQQRKQLANGWTNGIINKCINM